MTAGIDYISCKMDVCRELDADFNCPKIHLISRWVNRFIDTEPCNCLLPRYMIKHTKQISRTVGIPPITISTIYCKKFPFSVAFSTSKSVGSISKPSLSVGRTTLQPSKPSLPALIWLPPGAPSYMHSLNSCDLKTTLVETILTGLSSTSEHNLTILQMQHTV